MRVAYLECFAGISGDMFLGALVDAGVELRVLEEATAVLGLGATLRIGKVDRSGITSTKVDVMEGAVLAEAVQAEGRPDEQREPHTHQHHPRTQHLHKGGHDHQHHEHEVALREEEHGHSHEEEHGHAHRDAGDHGHAHGRSLTAIRTLIGGAALEKPVKTMALRAFELLGRSEAKIHNVPVDEIHFHEVGAVDAIVDIVAVSAGVYALEQAGQRETGMGLRWVCSALNVGGGMVECAHGTFPVPAPATADLLRGLPTYSAHVQKELVTPTGAALLRALAPEFGVQPAMRVERIGYGAGGRDPKGFPNVLRLSIGESTENGTKGSAEGFTRADEGAGTRATVVVLETALDDSSPQVVAHVMELLLGAGALDAMTTAVGMKKGRAATLVTVLAQEEDAGRLEAILLRETSTLGVRRRREQRTCLERTHVPVETEFGMVRVKVGSQAGEEMNAQPEFEDCRAAAMERGVPVKRVMAAAVAGYVGRKRKVVDGEGGH